jgi:propanediol dehydratase small subunit
MTEKLTIADYPLAETRSDRIKGQRGKSLDEITLDAVIAGAVTMEDLRITPKALADQAEISRAAKRPTLALNFERAAELVGVPQDFIMSSFWRWPRPSAKPTRPNAWQNSSRRQPTSMSGAASSPIVFRNTHVVENQIPLNLL